MARVVPFEAVHYNTHRFGQDLTRFVAPPYDVIDAVLERRLKEDRLNITYITLGDEGDSYATAAKRLKRWRSDEVLVKDEGRRFYLYEQMFQGPDGRPTVRSGLVGLVRLEEFSKGIILPHEKTMPKHKADRMALMQAVEGDTEQIFMLYEDPTGEMERILGEARKRGELLRFIDTEGVHHRIIPIEDQATVARMTALLEPAKLLIADGHHRYETSLEYRDRARGGRTDGDLPCDYVMTTLVSSGNPGLIVLPTHRLVKGLDDGRMRALEARLRERFDAEEHGDADGLARAVERSPAGSFGAWMPAIGTALLLRPRTGAGTAGPLDGLSVHVLQEQVLKPLLGYTDAMLDGKVDIDFVKGTGLAKAAMMAEDGFQACFFVKPPTVREVMAVAETGVKMPQKSTYFYPKIWSGTLLHLFG